VADVGAAGGPLLGLKLVVMVVVMLVQILDQRVVVEGETGRGLVPGARVKAAVVHRVAPSRSSRTVPVLVLLRVSRLVSTGEPKAAGRSTQIRPALPRRMRVMSGSASDPPS